MRRNTNQARQQLGHNQPSPFCRRTNARSKHTPRLAPPPPLPSPPQERKTVQHANPPLPTPTYGRPSAEVAAEELFFFFT